MKVDRRIFAYFFLFFGLVFLVWFIDGWIDASIPFLKDKLIFMAHWAAEVVAAGLSLFFGVALLTRRKVSVAALFFVLGMILSASFNGTMAYALRVQDWMVAVRLGVVFIAAAVCTILAWKRMAWNDYDGIRKTALLFIGILINLHSDTMLAHALSGQWAAFIHALLIILASLYFLGFLVRLRDGEA
jgi:hypothetical protein